MEELNEKTYFDSIKEYYNFSKSKKAIFRNLFAKKWGGAFTTVKMPSYSDQNNYRHVDVVIEDILYKIRRLNCKHSLNMTTLNIMEYVLYNVNAYLNHTNCKVYVIIFDKAAYVPPMKGFEQNERDRSHIKAQQKKNDTNPNYTVLIEELQQKDFISEDLEEDIKYPINQIINDRKTRKVFINEFCLFLEKYFYPPMGKTLIIDGGLIDDDRPIIITALNPAMETQNDKKFRNYNSSTILTQSRETVEIENQCSKTNVYRSDILKNAIGEADLSIKHYLNNLNYITNEYIYFKNMFVSSPEITDEDKTYPIKVDVIGIDTDLLSIYMHYIGCGCVDDNITMNLILNDSLDPHFIKNSDYQCMIDILLLAKMVNHTFTENIASYITTITTEIGGTKFKIQKKKDNTVQKKNTYLNTSSIGNDKPPKKHVVSNTSTILSMLAVVGIAGNDYVFSYKGYSEELLFKSFFLNLNYIGYLCTGDINTTIICPFAYMRFIRSMLATKHVPKTPCDVWSKDIGIDHAKLRRTVLKKILDDKNIKVPSPVQIFIRWLLLCTNTWMIKYGAFTPVSHVNAVSLEGGYVLMDPSKPISKDNIGIAIFSDIPAMYRDIFIL
ncbi:MAG: hypothetical protein EOP34_05740 [Rickettsiales bacterium]|nr:MAG: hypothetical protein EOP34_05740 [Rickettsiales bacterium]